MNYQINGRERQTGFGGLSGNAGIMGQPAAKDGGSILSNNSVGDLLTCKLVQGGKEPVLDINGIRMKTKATRELGDAQPGDTIFLKIKEADRKQVSLQIVGYQPTAGREGQGVAPATGMMPQSPTDQYAEMIRDNLGGVADEEEAKDNQKEILRTLSTDEIAELRMMQVDVSNATLSDLMGMVITLRSGEHQDEVNEQIGDIVKETLGKLRNAMMSDAAGTVSSGQGTVLQRVNRLNSEGYLVSAQEAEPASGRTGEVPDQSGVLGADGRAVSDEQMIYMVHNHMELTIGNVVTAKNSVNESSPSKTVPVDEQVWNDIYPQVTGIIESAGMTVSEQSLSGARFMLQHELPVTVDSLRMYMSVQALNQRGIPESQIEANINEQVMLDNPPEQARLSSSTLHDRAVQLVEKLGGIQLRAVDEAVLSGKSLTISYLYNSSMRSLDVRRLRAPVTKGVEGASLSISGAGAAGYQPEGAGLPLSPNPQAVAARRQLEEIRLGMTLEAASRLVRQDFNIDARPLAQVVEALRQQENRYYDDLASANELHDLPEGMDLLKETLKETEALKLLPEYALGELVRKPSITVGNFYESAVRSKLALAGQAYETLMTRPRRDMGDSITDAFQNVNDILTDLELDRNAENQRAVRILAFNEMELTPEHIVSVKAADAKVQEMFETLTPQIVLNLIRENKNPLHMTIDGLNQEIRQQRERLGVTDEQRFGEFLYQMEHTDGITEAERKSFIGIYRLLDRIEKSHGKDIGAVIRNGQEVTLHNLFQADKSRRARGMDVRLDTEFGQRENADTADNGILAQIETAYQQSLAGSLLRHIRPDTLAGMAGTDYRNMSLEELNALMREGDRAESTGLCEELSRELSEALSREEDVEMMLEANSMEKTATNILAAYQVMQGKDGIFGMIRDIRSRLPAGQRSAIAQRESSILENFDSRSDVVYGLENLRSAVSEAVHAKEEDGTITFQDIQALKYLNVGMPIAMRAVQEEVFQIPLVVGDEVSIMKVSLMRDGSHAGEINASMDTGAYGRLEAFVKVSGSQLEGYIVTEDEKGQRVLEENELTIRSVFAKAGMEARDLRLDGTRPMQYSREEAQVDTSKLYRVAKHLLTAIKLTGIAADNYTS